MSPQACIDRASDFGPDAFRSAKHFARFMLSGDRLLLRPEPCLVHIDELATCIVLFRSGRWQVELLILRPGADVPKHRHDRVESVELRIGGSGHAEIGGRAVPERERRRSLAANLLSIPRGCPHVGKAGPKGTAFLSFQMWSGFADFVATDWVAC